MGVLMNIHGMVIWKNLLLTKSPSNVPLGMIIKITYNKQYPFYSIEHEIILFTFY